MTTISAIIPTRDRPDYLAAAVASLLRQSAPPLEILVIDDGDGVAPRWEDRDGLIRVLSNHRRGPVTARILGIQAARGEAAMFLDDDDWITDPDYLAVTAAKLRAGAAFCFCDGEMVFDSGAPTRRFAQEASAETLCRDNTILVSGVCYRRSLHAKLGYFDIGLPYYWDWDWYLRVARSGVTPVRHAAPAVAVRVHDGNMSGAGNEADRALGLAQLARKHGLGSLALKNHLTFAE